MISLNIDYKKNSSELCLIGSKYDTDKSSQRKNVTNDRHSHPYTLFYDSLFNEYKDKELNIAEIGILEGASLLMWNEYFKNSKIYGYDYDDNFIRNFSITHRRNNIHLSKIDVTNENSIETSFKNNSVSYDIIIDDSTHQFEDQIKIIKNVHKYLKPGGILVIENIFKSYNENYYIERLNDVIDNFQSYYFVTLEHENNNSYGWDNDKLFVLVKKGEPIFKNKNKITIITPSYRTENLVELKKSINFDYVDEWLIVYDGSKIEENPNIFRYEQNPKIKEYIFKGDADGVSGNPQRNYALDNIKNPDTYLYFLDDDNIIHPDFYKLLGLINKHQMYTFDQENRIYGNTIKLYWIDTAMVLVHYELCRKIRWINHDYGADGYYIEECYKKNDTKWVYVNNTLCYYNKLIVNK